MTGKNKDPLLGWHPPVAQSIWVREEAARRGSNISAVLNEAVEVYRWLCIEAGRQDISVSDLLPDAITAYRAEPIWLYDDPTTGYHDGRCRCEGHCGNCYEDLAAVRSMRDRLIAAGAVGPNGAYTADDRLSERARYCSPYCKDRAKRDRAMGRILAKASLT